jgi:hypothetical protein
MIPEVPESAVRLEATGGTGLTFILERRPYHLLGAAVGKRCSPVGRPWRRTPDTAPRILCLTGGRCAGQSRGQGTSRVPRHAGRGPGDGRRGG